MKYSNKVRINEEKNPGSKSTKNMYAVDNVNQKSGPRTGNAGTPSKRSDFSTAKEARAPLADMIASAFGARAQDDYVNPKLEPISSNSKRSFKR
jgi:hypothetical protein